MLAALVPRGVLAALVPLRVLAALVPLRVLAALVPRGVLAALGSGSWLTPERVRAYPLLVGGVLALAVAALLAGARGTRDAFGNVLGSDFAGVWVAGRAVLAGHPAAPYDNALHVAAQVAAFGPTDGFLTWPYPPYFLAPAALAATVPYLAALALWQGATLVPYLAVTLAAAKPSPVAARPLAVAALAFPAVTINLLHGHNGFLTVALLAGGTLLVGRRPVLAGVLFGLLAYKPQFALMVPLALLAGGHWRTLFAAAATVAGATAATVLAFGTAPWRAFAGSLGFTRRVVLEGGGLEAYKLQSVFAAVRLVGGAVDLAYAAQGLGAGLAALAVWRLWRGGSDARLRLAGLILASLLATPYVLDYDLVVLGPALAALMSFAVAKGAPPYGLSLLAAAWAMPLGARVVAKLAGAPIGVLCVGGVLAMVVLCGRRGSTADAANAPSEDVRQDIFS